MGKILETTYRDTVEKITGLNSTLINNSFYTLNDKKPTLVTYYNIDRDASTLDPGSKIAYDNIGKDSPIRFNKIKDFIIYGFSRIEMDTQNDEFGLEADRISGECFVLPNTIIPTEGDYFEVDHITDSTWLFIITDVQIDTLENGSNVYKLSYKLEYVDHDRIQECVTDNYTMIEKREGTNISKIVKSDTLEIAKRLDNIAVMLKEYYNELFYNPLVQTFTYTDLTEWRVYDPYMIEFLIRNDILANGNDSYIHVCHQLEPVKTFSMDYDRTIFRIIEKKAVDKVLSSEYTIQLEEIKSYGTTFASRFETYFKAKYIKPPVGYRAQIIDDKLIFRIIENELVEDEKDLNNPSPLWQNIIIKYFNGGKYTEDEIKSVEELHYSNSMEAFYIIPILIFCLEYTIEKMLK